MVSMQIKMFKRQNTDNWAISIYLSFSLIAVITLQTDSYLKLIVFISFTRTLSSHTIINKTLYVIYFCSLLLC